MTDNISPHIFRAYDIRGLYNKDLTPEIMYQIGLAAGTYVIKELKGKEIVVGSDIRQTSIPLAYAFISGATAVGVDVTYVGTTAFGQTLFKGWKLEKDAIAFITGSHLPPEWNGIKFYFSDGVGFPEEELMKIRDICLTKEYSKVEWERIGKIETADAKQDYLEFFKNRMNFQKEIKVALDCGGASTTLSAPHVFREIGLEVTPIFCEPDPTFSARPSDPKPKNLTKLVAEVKINNCDFGVAFDGDGDRAVIVDDKGRVLSADQTGIILGKYGLEEKKGTVIVNVECSKSVGEQLEPLGFKIKQIPVGHTFLTLEAKNENSPLGIESSGHLILPEFFLFDDALVIPMRIAEIIEKTKRKLSELADEIPVYPLKKEEVKCSDELKFKVIDVLKDQLLKEYENVNTMDGIRVELERGWVLIRASNTSPLIRLTAEADNGQILNDIVDMFKNKLNKVIKQL